MSNLSDEEKKLAHDIMLQLIEVNEAAAELVEYTIENMNTDKLGLAAEDTSIAIGFLERLKTLAQRLAGEDDGNIDYEYTEDDSTSGSTEADSREESGDLRPSGRKLH